MSQCGATVFPPQSGNVYLRPLTLDPKQPDMENTYCLTELHAQEIRGGASVVMVYGRITYRDVYKGRRTSNFRFIYSGKWPPPEDMRVNIAPVGNESD
jgi:hypothetical protein